MTMQSKHKIMHLNRITIFSLSLLSGPLVNFKTNLIGNKSINSRKKSLEANEQES